MRAARIWDAKHNVTWIDYYEQIDDIDYKFARIRSGRIVQKDLNEQKMVQLLLYSGEMFEIWIDD